MGNTNLVPYETIVRATSGVPEAVDEVLRHYSKRIRFEVIFFYWSFCHIYSPCYILLFPFLLGYVYTVPLISHNNSYLYTCYYSYVRL